MGLYHTPEENAIRGKALYTGGFLRYNRAKGGARMEKKEEFSQTEQDSAVQAYNGDLGQRKRTPKHVAAWNGDDRAKGYMEDETWQTPEAKSTWGAKAFLCLLLLAVVLLFLVRKG
jgi:hypothetical protein